MKPADWQRLSAAFEELCDLPAERREAQLLALGATEPAVAAELRAMLAADAAAGGALAAGAFALLPDDDNGEESTRADSGSDSISIPGELAAGTLLGPWRLLERLGQGGMGEVWAAERADGTFEQSVAIKLLRRGLETDLLLRRFRQERQILARLAHPGIARLLDAGSTGDGRPFFVMERVEGRPITDWANARELAIEERLRLFLLVADAVDFAQRSLVVHRDLKPSNVLVTSSGEVKLLDFGIAKLLEREEGTQLTELGGWALTPAYAAPEQIRGEPVTTATDVYALGVLLYELLTGTLPHRRSTKSIPELVQDVERETVERPSGVVGRSKTDDRRARQLVGDLDTIVLAALAREPERRYPSAAALAADLRRHLDGRPIAARADSVGYRTRKFVRRHAAAVAAAVGITLAIALLTAAYTVRLARERDRARLESEKAQHIAAFLTGLFELTDLDRTRGAKLSARDILDRGAAGLATQLAGEPEVEATLSHLIGTVYRDLDLTAQARPLLERSLSTRRRLFGERDPEVARYERDLAILSHGAGDYEQAATLLRQALVTQEALLGNDHMEVARTLAGLANALKRLGQREAARPLFVRALAILERAPAEDAALAKVLSSYALFLTGDDDPRQAIALLRRAIAIEVRQHGAGSPSAGAYHLNLGVALRFAGDFDAALAADQQALAITEATYGREHTSYASILNEIGSSWAGKGDVARAREAYQRSIEVKEKVLGADHPSTLDAQRNLAMLLVDQDPRAARSLLEKVLAGNERALGPRHPGVAQSLFDLGKLRADQGGAAERAAAQAQMRRGLAIYRATPDIDSFDLASGLADLGALLCAGDQRVEGSPMLHEAVAIWTRQPSPYAPDLAKLAEAAQDCKPDAR